MFAFLFIMNSIIPITMIGFGLLWKNNPPKKINKLYGYRTNMSMKNDETWKFAHRYHGKVWYWSGIILLIFTIATMLILTYSYDDIEVISLLITFIQIVVMISAVILTEKALRNNFDENGESI